MIIKIPNNNINERKYILDIIFNEFLGVDYKLKVEEGKKESDWEIILENGKKLIIKDHFFNKFLNDLEYLKQENIPKKVEFTKNDFIIEDDIPIIYGSSTFKLQTSNLTCGIDIFASSFFMLTRWEEYVNKNRDIHHRFLATESLAYKFNFLDRPIVNEYIEMLKNILRFLGYDKQFKKREFSFVLTHDIDVSFRYRSFKDMIRELAGDLIKRKDLKLFFSDIKRQFNVLLKKEKDPYDTYDYLMDISEKLNTKSYFFLHSSNSSKFDVNNDKFLQIVANKVLKRGHYLGYHPSYNAYNDFNLFKKDKEKIENIINQKLTFGRAHYLRFEIPTTWQIWEDNKMEWDSTLSYADKEGFRCGVCYPFSVFNIFTREKLTLKERPLILMEGSLTTYQNFTPYEMENRIRYFIDKVKKYNGEFVFLWHNSSFNTYFWIKFQHIYEKVLLNG